MDLNGAMKVCWNLAKVTGLGLAGATLLATGANAGDSIKADHQIISVYLVKSGDGQQVSYNKNPRRYVVKISAAQYMKNNLYVCTPSGFGQKARCYARGLSL